MIGFGVLMLMVVGAVWLCGALVGGLFKLAFGLVGALAGGVFAMIAIGFAMLFVLPVVILVLLPLLLPALGIAALVWVIVRASRSHPPMEHRIAN